MTEVYERVKAVIIVGGPTSATRFRPLSLNVPKPLFNVGGREMIYHHCEALSKFGDRLKTVYLLGSFEESTFKTFIDETSKSLGIKIEYLREHEPLGTAGGILYFKDTILSDSDYLFVIHSDIACTFPLIEILSFHKEHGKLATLMGTTVPKEYSVEMYGCYVRDKDSKKVIHYAEKPKSFVSNTINAGIYCFSTSTFEGKTLKRSQSRAILFDYVEVQNEQFLSMEIDVLPKLTSEGQLYVYEYDQFWISVKDAGSTVYCNELYLLYFSETKSDILTKGSNIIGSVIIDSTAKVDPSSKIGPNVYIGPNTEIGKGVRIANSIVMKGVNIHDHSCILFSIIGPSCKVGEWSRIEGIKSTDGFYISSKRSGISILGQNVTVNGELIIRNCVILPHKEIKDSHKDEIIL